VVELTERGVKLLIQQSVQDESLMYKDFHNPGRTNRSLATREFLERLEQELWGGSS
jgi:hypothetical protein